MSERTEKIYKALAMVRAEEKRLISELVEVEQSQERRVADIISANAASLAKAAKPVEAGDSGILLKFDDVALGAVNTARGPVTAIVPWTEVRDLLNENGMRTDQDLCDGWQAVVRGEATCPQLKMAFNKVACTRFHPGDSVRVGGAVIYRASAWGEWR